MKYENKERHNRSEREGSIIHRNENKNVSEEERKEIDTCSYKQQLRLRSHHQTTTEPKRKKNK